MRTWTCFALLAVVSILASSVTPLDAQRRNPDKPNWKEKFPNYEKLGEREVDFGADKDTITVGAVDGRFVSVIIGVDDGNLEMWDIKFTFGNDETYSPDVRAEFTEDTRSRQIDLPGEARIIKTVTFKYKSKRAKGKATVMLLGKKGDGSAGNDAPDLNKRHKEFEHLGTRKVDFGADKDTIDVGAKDGRFTAIKLDVDDGELVMWNIKVTFGNDDSYSPDTRLEFAEGSRSRQIDLPGEARVIKKIEFAYKSRISEGKATVQVFGKRAGGDVNPNLKEKFPNYTRIGTREVDFAKDTDILIVGESKGKFSSIIIEVEDGELEMHDITITFGNGKQHSPEIRHEFKENSRSRQIDLPGEARTIERIAFKYKSSKKREGKAEVKVWGK